MWTSAPGDQPQGDVRFAQRRGKFVDGPIDERAAIVVDAGEDVRRAGNRRDAVGDRETRHLQRHRDVRGAVVNPRQDVTVKIDQGIKRLCKPGRIQAEHMPRRIGAFATLQRSGQSANVPDADYGLSGSPSSVIIRMVKPTGRVPRMKGLKPGPGGPPARKVRQSAKVGEVDELAVGDGVVGRVDHRPRDVLRPAADAVGPDESEIGFLVEHIGVFARLLRGLERMRADDHALLVDHEDASLLGIADRE